VAIFALVAAVVALGGPLQPTSVADAVLTPGVVRQDLTLEQIKTTKWGDDHRAVTEAMKAEVYRRYGFSGPKDPRCTPDRNGETCEVDHRLPRCAGGADAIENLSPQPYGGAWNAHMKDRVEDRACRAIQDGSMSLTDAQAIFLGDWTVTYRTWFGDPPAGD
jgi:hypothetical protein